MRAQPDKAKQAPRVLRQDLFTRPWPPCDPTRSLEYRAVPGNPQIFLLKTFVCLQRTSLWGLRELISDNCNLSPWTTSGSILPCDTTNFRFSGVCRAQGRWHPSPRYCQQGRTFLFSLVWPKLKRMWGGGRQIEGVCIGDCERALLYWSTRTTAARIIQSLGEGSCACRSSGRIKRAINRGRRSRSGAAVFAEQCGNR